MNIHQRPFGEVRQQTATLFEMINANGCIAAVSDFGATLVAMAVPDRRGNLDDVVLGFESADEYDDHADSHFGGIVGRCASRIADGRVTIDGQGYRLETNDNGRHHLHGGAFGFDRQFWKARCSTSDDALRVTLEYHSPSGEQKYPGALDVTVVYELNNDDELSIEYTAATDAPTLCNLTHHPYWNLLGVGTGECGLILDHELQINAPQYTPCDEELIPNGEIEPVHGTPMDFTQPHRIGQRITATPGGYDHNYVLRRAPGELIHAATLREPHSGRVLEIHTTEPCLQLYTGNFLDGSIRGKNRQRYPRCGGVCLEAQRFPDAERHENFPTVVLRPGETYSQKTVHRFYV